MLEKETYLLKKMELNKNFGIGMLSTCCFTYKVTVVSPPCWTTVAIVANVIVVIEAGLGS